MAKRLSKDAKSTATDQPKEQTADQQNAAAGYAGPNGAAEDLRNQLLRTQADFQNFKRRTEEDRGRMVGVARADVILSLLPVFDNFDRAFKEVPEAVTKTDWFGGVQAIKSQFDSVLQELGIDRIETVGQEFDPNQHEAISHEASPEFDQDIISEEFEAGYRLGDEVLRHAKVKVSSGKGDAK